RRDGARRDHVATHLDYEHFSAKDAQKVIDVCRKTGLRVSVGAYENLLDDNEAEAMANRDHLLKLIRIAYLLGGDAADVVAGTFVGYNHRLGRQDRGFEKNLALYRKVFTPIIKYAEDLGVTVVYENCPMEGWRPLSEPTTYNNLQCTLAARKLMYALIPSKAHGETYDPSHDVWQHINPADVIRNTDPQRLKRIHIKGTRNRYDAMAIHWGRLFPVQQVDAALAAKAGVPTSSSSWDRHNYDPALPGFGGSDSMDWRAFIDTLNAIGYDGRPYVIENEAWNSSHTGNAGATDQGFAATILNCAPLLWPLGKDGYKFDRKAQPALKDAPKDIPVTSYAKLAK
ncbi:MAG: sugar phosphate isomerase/epimerase, partial [Kiritimatiellae bacterium]|nr:sugar phosphate isomerase/epimerase [Kiritimatiellia bacterium]